MPTDAIYFRDLTNPISGWRYRVEVQPPALYSQTIEAVQLPFDLGTPAFNATPGGASSYIAIPDDGLLGTLQASTQFDGYPIGLQAPPTLKVAFDLPALHRAGLDDLIAALLSPQAIDAGRLNIDGFLEYAFDTSTVIRLLTDYGSGTLPVENFTTEFIGAITRTSTTDTLKLSRVPEQCELEINAVHLGAACLEAITPTILAQRFFADHAGDGYPKNSADATGVLYDVLFKDGSTTYGRTFARYKDDDGNFDWARLFRFRDLMDSFQSCYDQVYRSFTRLNINTPSTVGFYSLNDRDPNADPTDNASVPTDTTLRLFRRDYTAANLRGNDLLQATTSGTEPGNDAYFVGGIWHSDTARDVPNAIGGFLIRGDEDSLYQQWPECRSFLQDWIGSVGCKATYSTPTRDSLRVNFARVHDSKATPARLRIADFLNTSGVDAELSIAADLVSGAAMAVRGLGDEAADVFTVTIDAPKGGGTGNDVSLPSVFHNSPTVGDGANRFRMTGTDPDDAAYNPDLSRPHVIVASTGHRSLPIWYIDTPSFSGSSIAIRIGDTFAYDDGSAEFIDGQIIPYPLSTAGSEFELLTDLDGKYWNAAKAAMIVQQQTAACTYSIPFRLATMFGDVRQSRVTAEIDLDALQLAHHGERVILEDDNGNDVGLAIFGSYGADVVAGESFVTKIEADYAKHTAKVELFTIPN